MDEFDTPEASPRHEGIVRCLRCGQVFSDDLLYLNPATGEWCCKDWPTCEGSDTYIEIADGRRRIEKAEWYCKLEFKPAEPYPPPEEPTLVRCVVCRRFYMSSELRWENGKWKCWFKQCDGYGYGLNIFKWTDGIFARVGAFGVYRQRSRRTTGD